MNARSSWATMKQCCFNRFYRAYPRVGGVGITCPPEWRKLSGFLADMGEKPPDTILCRRDYSANYSKENCYWRSRKLPRPDRMMYSNNSTGYKGVTFHCNNGKWMAYVRAENGRQLNLGYFNSPEAASEARLSYLRSVE